MISCDEILFGTKMSLLHLIIILSCWSAYTSVLAQKVCDGWFGPGCKYQCHCKGNRCRLDGTCSLGCAKGWFGPQCQYEDIGPPLGNSLQPLFDGDEASCIRMTEGTIYLKTEIPFTWMRLQFVRHVEQDQVSIEFYKTWNQPSIQCDKRNVSIVKNGVLDIHCDVHSTIKTIIIKMTSQAPLCSVYVSGGRNIALKQHTEQTGTYLHLNTYDYSRSENAVDGNPNGYFDQKSCTHTEFDSEGQTPSWTVRLSGLHVVNRYRIYNRRDEHHRARLKGFKLTSYDAHNWNVFDYQRPPLEVNDLYTVMHEDGVGKQISQVTIQGTKIEKILNLCEVEIFGDSICSFGRYGRDCEHTCNCADRTEACLVSTGGCASGCAAGYTGEGCLAECPPKLYGMDCKLSCDISCFDQLCHNVNGSCKACSSGKMGERCDQDCAAGKYGLGCSETCSINCGEDGGCSPVTGHCNYGCKEGYTGDRCENECEIEKYGPECKTNCSEFCLSDVTNSNTTSPQRACDHVTGECLKGCQSGYGGFRCLTGILRISLEICLELTSKT